MSVQAENLRAGYGEGADVLHDVCFDVPAGASVGLIGANGAGKSTLLKVLCGFLPARAGTVCLSGRVAGGDGAVPTPHQLAARGIGYLMEGHSVFPGMTVEENLLLGTWSFRGDRARVKRSVDAAYAQSPFLATKRHLRAGLLSGGQQRLLELERLALLEPSLIVLDEPSMGLAPKLVHEVFERVVGLARGGASVIVVDQSARQVCEMCDTVYVMRLGRIEMQGTGTEFAARIDDVVREFI